MVVVLVVLVMLLVPSPAAVTHTHTDGRNGGREEGHKSRDALSCYVSVVV